MKGFIVDMPPPFTFAYKLAELAWVYLGLSREPGRLIITDLADYKGRLMQIVELAKNMRVRIRFTDNDGYFVSHYSDWLGLDKYTGPIDLLSKYAESVDKLVNDKKLFKSPSIFKINFYENERRMGLRDSKIEMMLDGHQIALCLAGAHLAFASEMVAQKGKKGKKHRMISMYVLLPRRPSVIPPKEADRLRKYHERIKKALQHVFRGREAPPTSVVLLYLSASLIREGEVEDDGVYGSMTLVQEGAKRASILSIEDISTHGLVRLLRDDERRAASACLALIDAYLDIRGRNMGGNFVRLVEGSSSRLLVYSISGSLDALYNAISGLDRLAKLLRDPQTISQLRMSADKASWLSYQAELLSAHLAEKCLAAV